MNPKYFPFLILIPVFICAVAYAQPIGGFTCKEGICTPDEATVDRIQYVINKLVEIIEGLKAEKEKGQCT